MNIIYKIIDTKTGLQIGKDYSSRSRANRRVDKLDNEYGGYRYSVRAVYPMQCEVF